MTTDELLLNYGYTGGPDVFLPARPSSERWERTDGGWLCYRGAEQVPFRCIQGGVNPQRPQDAPEAFEWVWPDERLQEIYAHAVRDGDNPWVKTGAGYEKVAS